jgi:uncharacterized repeat protein (TIGR03837 family)
MAMTRTVRRWDIFCAVVDNYGDAGFCWRLARQLAAEHELSVRLFIDALPTLARMVAEIDPRRAEQVARDVTVRRWDGPSRALAGADCADVVIEAFGCGLPPSYVAAMAARERQPAWVNLEYLSAESWIEGCHGLPSRHPSLPLTRHFFFPGFTAASGGLLRERDLLAQRDRFRADAAARAEWWRGLGLGIAGRQAVTVSLFCYADAALAALLEAWAEGDEAVLCVVPEGVATSALDAWTGGGVPRAGQQLSRGRLTIAGVPFLEQDRYDRLLWSCDANFVRGEESFVRAQWAGQPFVWQPYPQAEDAHRLKLDAFLERYTLGLGPEAAAALRSLSEAWNDCGDAGAAWGAFAAARPALEAHTQAWAARLAAMSDLATNLVRFCPNLV